MGTGIYRARIIQQVMITGVPCGYRDIPIIFININFNDWRSLWVQGYTELHHLNLRDLDAFPVGTGIYRCPLKRRRAY